MEEKDMKRIISKLLVLTIACSTLMSVMLNEVSAEDPTEATKTTEYTDSDTTRTMTCDLSGAESGYKYKVFLFESLASAVPLAEMVEGTID